MGTNYDAIATDYQEAKQSPWRLEVELWSLFQRLGDVSGLRVLDLACGEGFYTRRLRLRGAERVVGVDLSAGMIALAEDQEQRNPLGIEYVVEDARKLALGEQFDVVFASYLLNYAQTEQDLEEMARAISAHLVAGGHFVTVNNNPAQALDSYGSTREYGFVKQAGATPLRPGTPITYTCFLDGGRSVQFDNYWLPVETHERALRTAGLGRIRWHAIDVSPEGERSRGRAYWQPLLDAQPVICLDCWT
jgi:2-polyprenyl-3-methyl-5-hydroxy-6-metoxy-1,4-benzoquinol methylase